MTEINIELPDEYEFMKDVSPLYWILAAKKIRDEREKKIKKIERIKTIAAKSQATDEDAEELTKEIEEAMTEHYSQY
jgi:hypothetical protein